MYQLLTMFVLKFESVHYTIPGPEVIKLVFMLNLAGHEICPANMKLLTTANSFLLNIAEHENFSPILLLAFSYLLAEKISSSAELSM